MAAEDLPVEEYITHKTEHDEFIIKRDRAYQNRLNAKHTSLVYEFGKREVAGVRSEKAQCYMCGVNLNFDLRTCKCESLGGEI